MDGMPQDSGGLARYHSAPSALLESLLEDDFFSEEPCLFSQARELEYARYLCGDLGPSTVGSTKDVTTDLPNTRLIDQKEVDGKRLDVVNPQFLAQSELATRRIVLASISEEPSVESFNLSPPPATLKHMRLDGQGMESQSFGRDSVPSIKNLPSCIQKHVFSSASSMSQVNSNLIRHRSSPAGLLSRLAMEEIGESHQTDSSYMHSMIAEAPPPSVTSPKASSFGTVAGFPDDDMLGQRERGRGGLEPVKLGRLPRCPEGPDVRPLEQYSSSMLVGSGTAAGNDMIPDDSVICRARAKRGCATHPRSVAERVRRTKISHAMRKLQDLVPNKNKQSSTAEMLDEAVNYIQFLQHQVQKLSERQCKCNCNNENRASP